MRFVYMCLHLYYKFMADPPDVFSPSHSKHINRGGLEEEDTSWDQGRYNPFLG